MLDQIHDISLQNQELPYIRSNDLLSYSEQIIETARDLAYKAINVALVRSNMAHRMRPLLCLLQETSKSQFSGVKYVIYRSKL